MIPSEKQLLRAEIRQRITSMEDAARAGASRRIQSALIALGQWANAKTIFLFAPLRFEPDCVPRSLTAKRFCFPKIRDDHLHFFALQELSSLKRSRYGILEPASAGQLAEIPAAEADFVLVPGLAFDRAGGRLGRGGGFYDRFLASVRPATATVGVCFALQLVRAVPMESHDVAVRYIVTESETIVCGTRSNRTAPA